MSAESLLFDLGPSLGFLLGGEMRVELVRLREAEPAVPTCGSAAVAVEYWKRKVTKTSWYDPQKEITVVLGLNTKHEICFFNLVSVGSLNEGLAHSREVFRAAIVGSAYAVILMHNHPSGNPIPSRADVAVTRRLSDVGQVVGIQLLDHVIVGAATHYSFKQNGILDASSDTKALAIALKHSARADAPRKPR